MAYLGPKGTFTHLAAQELFSNEWTIPYKPFQNVLRLWLKVKLI